MTVLVIAEHDNNSIKGATLNTVTAAKAMCLKMLNGSAGAIGATTALAAWKRHSVSSAAIESFVVSAICLRDTPRDSRARRMRPPKSASTRSAATGALIVGNASA